MSRCRSITTAVFSSGSAELLHSSPWPLFSAFLDLEGLSGLVYSYLGKRTSADARLRRPHQPVVPSNDCDVREGSVRGARANEAAAERQDRRHGGESQRRHRPLHRAKVSETVLHAPVPNG